MGAKAVFYGIYIARLPGCSDSSGFVQCRREIKRAKKKKKKVRLEPIIPLVSVSLSL